MEKPSVIFHLLIENRYEAGLIEQTLRSPLYDSTFVMETESTLQFSTDCLEVVLLEPSMSRWEWLDLLIRLKAAGPDRPVILYSREMALEGQFQRLGDETRVFLASDVTALADQVRQIILPKQQNPKTILIVDDELAMLKSYGRILRKRPWRVLTADRAERALETLENEVIDLVITDIKMPDTHGIELLSKIRQKHKELPVIVCSGFPGMKDDQTLRFHRIADFIEKPVDEEVLKRKIERVLG
jgi:DNA-binding NtrC family response regulator